MARRTAARRGRESRSRNPGRERPERGGDRDSDAGDERDERRRSRSKSRGMDPTVTVGLCIGTVFLMGVVAVVFANQEPPPPPPKAEPAQTVQQYQDEDGNLITKEQADAIRAENERIKKLNEERKSGKSTASRTRSGKTASSGPKNAASSMYEEMFGDQVSGSGPASTGNSGDRPVPGFMRDNSGQPIGGNSGSSPKPTTQPEDDKPERKASPLAPWKNHDTGGEG